jgi:hypothetical protein
MAGSNGASRDVGDAYTGAADPYTQKPITSQEGSYVHVSYILEFSEEHR